jgi:hypothetical protein
MMTFAEFTNMSLSEGARIKPSRSRSVALLLAIRIHRLRDRLKRSNDVGKKLDIAADLITTIAYLNLLMIATDADDPNLLQRAKPK